MALPEAVSSKEWLKAGLALLALVERWPSRAHCSVR
jgi:hypothetical protein